MDREVSLSVKPFGLDDKLHEIHAILNSGTSIVGLIGVGGAGMSTLSKVLFNTELRNYQKSCYLENIASKHIQDVQKQLYHDLFGRHISDINVENKHLDEIRRCFKEKKVLVVVDDVETERNTLEDLQMCGWEESASKVIITCRNEDVFMNYGVDKSKLCIVKVEGIKDVKRSDMELFSCYAFDGVEEKQRGRFLKVAEEIVDYCEGLPLSLEVMGQYLCELQDKNDHARWEFLWNGVLQRLQDAKNLREGVDDKLWSCFRTSYDSLCEDEQELFMAFACFFSKLSWLKRTTIEWMLDSPNGLQHLINRSFIKVGSDDESLNIHNQLQGFGQYILKEKYGENILGSIYLCDHEKGPTFLREYESSTSLRGLSLAAPYTPWWYPINMIQKEKSEKLEAEVLSLATKALDQSSHQQYSQLKFLHLKRWSTTALVEYCLSKCSQKLKWLHLDSSTISTEGLQQVWMFKELRVLQLKNCWELVEIPDSLCDLIHIVELQVNNCPNLKRLPIRIGNLKQLKRLDFSWCVQLATIPEDISQLLKLEFLSFERCQLKGSINFETSMDNLREFIVARSSLQTLKGLSNLHNLQTLIAGICPSLHTCDLQWSLEKLLQLQTLDLCGCWESSQEIAEAFGNLQLRFDHLEVLNLPIIPKTRLPPCPRLRVLWMDNGLKLQTLDHGLFSNVPGLDVLKIRDDFNHGALKELPSSLWKLAGLRSLFLSGFEQLEEVTEPIKQLWNLVGLQRVFLSGFTQLEELPESIEQLLLLQSLELWECVNLVRIPASVADLPHLSNLRLYDCPKVDWEEASHCFLREKLLERGCKFSSELQISEEFDETDESD